MRTQIYIHTYLYNSKISKLSFFRNQYSSQLTNTLNKPSINHQQTKKLSTTQVTRPLKKEDFLANPMLPKKPRLWFSIHSNKESHTRKTRLEQVLSISHQNPYNQEPYPKSSNSLNHKTKLWMNVMSLNM